MDLKFFKKSKSTLLFLIVFCAVGIPVFYHLVKVEEKLPTTVLGNMHEPIIKVVDTIPIKKKGELEIVPLAIDTNIEVNGLVAGGIAPETSTDILGVVVESMPSFPGGEEAMMTYLEKKVRYPKEAAENGIEGIVYIEFVVEENGDIVKSKILRGLSEEIDNEALRVIRNMPKWIPGENDGKPVPASFVLPIKFELN